jgi:hypothetical protein
MISGNLECNSAYIALKSCSGLGVGLSSAFSSALVLTTGLVLIIIELLLSVLLICEDVELLFSGSLSVELQFLLVLIFLPPTSLL